MSTKRLTLNEILELDRNALKSNPQTHHFHRKFFKEELPFPLPQARETIVVRLKPGSSACVRLFIDASGNQIDLSSLTKKGVQG